MSDNGENTHQLTIVGYDIGPYHREYKGYSWDWQWGEVFLESHAIVALVLEPHDIDSFLDDGVLILAQRIHSRIGFLRVHRDQYAPNGNTIWGEANAINESHVGQQFFCVRCIVAYAPNSLIWVKTIQSPHGTSKSYPHVRDEAYAIDCEL